MKKIIFSAAVIAFGLVNAQKNTLLVGGNVSYNTTKQELSSNTDTKIDNFEFSPTIGYQFTDNWTAGVNTSFASSKYTNDYSTYNVTTTDKTNKYGAFVRYAQPLGNTFAVYGDLGVGLQDRKVETKNSLISTTSTTKYDGMYAQFTPALFINFKNSFGLNFNIGGIGYGTMKDKATSLKTNSFDVNFGKSFSVGISKNFKL